MLITGLFHIAIKTNDLETTVRFYTEILGLRTVPRPDFGFPVALVSLYNARRRGDFSSVRRGTCLGKRGDSAPGNRRY
uniref:VOC family protein n=1 Tax=Desertifilum tharense IPPAS B-1220 TaxID=1781255 RepID=A0ACD5GPJ5_9CYAN